VGPSGAINDAVLQNAYVKAKGGLVGPLAALNQGTIKGAVVQGTAVGRGNVGGLAGDNQGTVRSSYANTSVQGQGSKFVASPMWGGLVATNEGNIADSRAAGLVQGQALVNRQAGAQSGGLAGLNSASGTIANSSATGAVIGNLVVGGLAGSNAGAISASFATGDVHGHLQSTAGGLAGLNSGSIEASFATGAVDSGSSPNPKGGGLVGAFTGGSLAAVYSTGAVTGNGTKGGLIGTASSTVGFSDAYWDIDTSGQNQGVGNNPIVPGITGLTDAQLKSALPAGFDPAVWAQDPNINNGWPYLLANPPQ
jgi:hypothetical protein